MVISFMFCYDSLTRGTLSEWALYDYDVTQHKVQINLLILIRAFQFSWAQSYTHRHRVWEKHPQAVPLFWISWDVIVWTLMAASLGSLACGICRVLTDSSSCGICALSYRNIKHVSSWAGEMDLWLRACTLLYRTWAQSSLPLWNVLQPPPTPVPGDLVPSLASTGTCSLSSTPHQIEWIF